MDSLLSFRRQNNNQCKTDPNPIEMGLFFCYRMPIFITLSVLVIGGSIPGAMLLKNADVKYLKVFFGIVVILIAIEMLLREYQNKKSKESKTLLLVIGVLSGVLCGLFGIGALLAAYVGRVTTTTKDTFHLLRWR